MLSPGELDDVSGNLLITPNMIIFKRQRTKGAVSIQGEGDWIVVEAAKGKMVELTDEKVDRSEILTKNRSSLSMILWLPKLRLLLVNLRFSGAISIRSPMCITFSI